MVGPNTASQLRAFAAEPEPELATRDQVEVMIAKLSMATAGAKVGDEEAKERLELYWLALSDMPVIDLRVAFTDLLRTAKFLPTPAEVRTAALKPGAQRKHAKSRAGHLAWLHDQEWREPVEMADPTEVKAVLNHAA